MYAFIICKKNIQKRELKLYELEYHFKRRLSKLIETAWSCQATAVLHRTITIIIATLLLLDKLDCSTKPSWITRLYFHHANLPMLFIGYP